MPEFPYTVVPGKIAPFYSKVRSVGVPQHARAPWLKGLGFTSSNDTSLLPVAKALGFLDASSVPTQRWKDYRGARAEAVMGQAIREAYRGLFDMYADAPKRTDEELGHFFRTKSSGGDQVIAKTVSTFKALASLASFAEEDTADVPERVEPQAPNRKQPVGHRGVASPGADLHINVQIHIASDATAAQIDQIFASMGKHLYRNND